MRGFSSLSNFSATGLEVIKLEPSIRAVLELDEPRHVVERKNDLKMPVSLLMKKRYAVLVSMAYRFRDSGGISINVPYTKGQISLTL